MSAEYTEKRIRICLAEESDLDSIAALEAAIFSDAWHRGSIEESWRQEYVSVFAAKQEEKVVGYLICYRMLNEGNIVRVAVDPACRRQGVGRLLMQYLIAAGPELGLTEYSLEVRVTNEPAISMYREFSFTEEGIRKKYYTDPVEDGLIMWRR